MIDFKIKNVPQISGVKLISYTAYEDQRGSIFTSYQNQIEFELGHKFLHDKFVLNEPNSLRGLHGDNKTTKLVTCVSGKVKQVILDVRPGSDTYGHGFQIEINQRSLVSLLIPAGVANAFHSTSAAVYHYKLAYSGAYADYDEQFSYHWQSPIVQDYWGDITPVLSLRDNNAKVFLP